MKRSPLTFRPGTYDDSYTVFTIFERSLADLVRRFGSTEPTSAADPQALQRMWDERQSLYEHLANTCEHFWLTERDGEAVGFARSILRDGLLQLTEMFVLPGEQSRGIGRELIGRVFPADDGISHRSIIASTDNRAQALYLKAGVYPRLPLYYFGRSPERVSFSSDLVFKPIQDSPSNLAILAEIDKAVLGFKRDVDHSWFLTERDGFLYFRGGKPVGYGYLGVRNGPFALFNPKDFPDVLAHAESQAADNGHREFGVELPMVNTVAVDYLLERGFKMDVFLALVMNDDPVTKFENYIVTSPPFFL
jgi:GNAT superfamily N-acetyltransferase